jgi:hypothetical protein
MLDWLLWLNQCMSALVATWGVPEASDDDKIISPEASFEASMSTSFVVVGQHVWPWSRHSVRDATWVSPKGVMPPDQDSYK